MATQTQLQLEPLSGCVHEQMLQAEYTRQRWRIHTLCGWMLRNATEARQVELQIFLEVWRGAEAAPEWGATGKGDVIERESEREDERLGAAFAGHFRALFAEEESGPTPARAASGLREAVHQLPARERLLYLLHELEGYSPALLGEWLDLDPAYCSSLIHHARVQLRDAVSN